MLTPTALGMIRHPGLPGVQQLGRTDTYYVTISMESRIPTTQGPVLKPHRSVIKVTSQRMGSYLRSTLLTRQLAEFFFFSFFLLQIRELATNFHWPGMFSLDSRIAVTTHL